VNALPVSLLYTRDAALRQRIGGLLHNRANVRVVQDPPELELLLHQHHGMVVFMDLRATDCARLLPELMQRFPEVVLIALGGARSDPGLYAAATGVYAIESANPDRLRLQTLFDQAQSHLRLLQENRLLRENRAHPPVSAVPERAPFVPVFDRFVSAYKRFDNVGIMLESLVEGIAAYARVARVAVFSIMSPEVYRFRAGVKCLEETRALEFSQTHPFVQWLQLHAHSLSRAMLRHIEPVEERLLLEHMLDLTGAEAILPLFGRQRLVGWLCLGRMISGAPLERCDIEELIPLAEQVSVTIENALLHESLAEQKALAETLLQSIPVGIIATGPDGTIRWFNRGAETLLKMAAAELIGQPVERHSSFLGSLLKRCMAGAHPEGPVEWTDPATGRALGIQLRRLSQDGQCMGALALIQDLTEERIWREKQNNLERATFWNELASAISHEVRNPLVAISTLAQLLPERYNDQEFRTQFRDLTTQEVSRLNGMIDQLDQYANPPRLEFAFVDPGELLETARCQVRSGESGPVAIEVEAAPGLPPIRGDRNLLVDALVRLLQNALAAVEGRPGPRVTLRASSGEIGSGRPALVLEVLDNGPGIPAELRDKVFSPFCTTKARGVGLGLPVVRRTMIDHGGLIEISTGPPGTIIRLTLPAAAGEGGLA